MKHIIIRLTTLFAIITFLFVSCDSSKYDSQAINEITEEVEKENSLCPLNCGNNCTMTSVSYEHDRVIYTYVLDVSENQLDDFKETPVYKMIESDSYKQALVAQFKAGIETNNESKRFSENIIKTESSIAFEYYTKNGTPIFSILITSAELKKGLNME